ncbi:MAG: class I SAM-dependent methyltransferase [Gammaproteobacteria bacterium]
MSVLRLNIGGNEPRTGWKILNAQAGEHVDFIAECSDLTQFPDASIAEVYASHVYEHLSYNNELERALREVHRVLVPGGRFRVSVPDFELLCRMFLHPQLNPEQRFYIMNVVFGGQLDPYDYHKVGLTWEFLSHFLLRVGFVKVQRVSEFDLFPNDCSSLRVSGVLISLNVEAIK